MTQTESQIRSAIYKALQMAIRPNKGFIFQIEVGGRGQRTNRNSVGQTGASDLFMIYRGMSVALEVKTPEGKQKKSQKEFEANIDAAGGYYFLVRSIDDALAVLKGMDQLGGTG